MPNIINTTPFIFQNGTVADATQVNADFQAVQSQVNAGAAATGVNSDITQLTALTNFISGAGTVSSTLNVGGPLNVTGVGTFSADVLMAGSGQLDLPSGTTAQRSASPNTGMIRYNTDTSNFEGYGGLPAGWGVLGAPPAFPMANGLKIISNAGSPASKVDVTVAYAQLVAVGNSSGKVINSVSLTIDGNVTGANGTDVGTVSSVDNWYYVWLISTGTVTAGLFSLSPTAPTLPSGYIYSMRIGAVRFEVGVGIFNFTQFGNKAQFTTSRGMAVTGGLAAVGRYVPPTATAIRYQLSVANTGANASAGTSIGLNGAALVVLGSANGFFQQVTVEGLLVSPNVNFSATGGSSAIFAQGWTDSVLAS